MKSLVVYIVVLILAGCASTSQTSSSSDEYHEDLSVYRPPVIFSMDTTTTEGSETPVDIPEPVFDITHELDSLLDTLAINNQKQRYIDGYTIQVYTGNSRVDATEVRNAVFGILPGSDPTISYDLPNYKVKVGKYYQRLEAQRDFAAIKSHFNNTILVPQQFRIE